VSYGVGMTPTEPLPVESASTDMVAIHAALNAVGYQVVRVDVDLVGRTATVVIPLTE